MALNERIRELTTKLQESREETRKKNIEMNEYFGKINVIKASINIKTYLITEKNKAYDEWFKKSVQDIRDFANARALLEKERYNN